MFGQNTKRMVSVPIDEYAELIELKTQMNAVYRLLTDYHVKSLEDTGRKAVSINIDLLEIASGYEENENYFKDLQENFKRRSGKLCRSS